MLSRLILSLISSFTRKCIKNGGGWRWGLNTKICHVCIVIHAPLIFDVDCSLNRIYWYHSVNSIQSIRHILHWFLISDLLDGHWGTHNSDLDSQTHNSAIVNIKVNIFSCLFVCTRKFRRKSQIELHASDMLTLVSFFFGKFFCIRILQEASIWKAAIFDLIINWIFT